MAQVEYLALGNPTLDVQSDGGAVVGGSAVYAALQAARLGLRSAIIGRASWTRLKPYWQPYAQEVQLLLQSSNDVTEFRNVSAGRTREQWLINWAGEIQHADRIQNSDILHLAPVARELRVECLPSYSTSRLVCLTPQGLLREQSKPDGRIYLKSLQFSSRLSRLVDIVVVAEVEAPYTMPLLTAVARQGGISVITKGHRGCELLTKRGSQRFLAAPAKRLVDTTGAGDCFAATLSAAIFSGISTTCAVRLALCAAAISVEGQGPESIGSHSQVLERAAKYVPW